jgi:CheY-like chemotaxis protein
MSDEPSSASSEPAGPATDQLQVLIVEDDVCIQELLTDVLVSHGYHVTTTSSGLGAAALVRRLRPDVVLLDLGLPYRSGINFLQEIKFDPQTSDVPVVILSAMTEMLPPERRAAAAAVLTKPVSIHRLLRAVREAIATPR